MKQLLLILPVLVMAAAIRNLPIPESTFSIETLSLTAEQKEFVKPLYADGSFIGMDGNSYYSLGQNNYQSSNGDVYYGYGQNTYIGSHGDTTYYGLGGVGGVGGHSGMSFSSLQRIYRAKESLPQPQLALALN